MKHQTIHPYPCTAATTPASQPLAKPVLSIAGLGFAGLVSTACLASLGHRVIGCDLDRARVDRITKGESPLHEDGLGPLLTKGIAQGLIRAGTDLTRAVRDSEVTFVLVDTPVTAEGGWDYSLLQRAARAMAVGLCQKEGFHVFALRSPVPPGTTMKVLVPILEKISRKRAGRDFGLCFNPEYLRSGTAIKDFHAPPKTVIGTTDFRTTGIMRQIYAPIDPTPIITTIEVAETIKYVDTAWHATQVCFANEVCRLCKPLGIDSHALMEILEQSQKPPLNPNGLKPGFAYGSSSQPKELRALTQISNSHGVNLPLIGALEMSNREQLEHVLAMVLQTGARRVGILGLALDPGTDELRASPILEIMAALQDLGISMVAHDSTMTRETPLDGLMDYCRQSGIGLSRLANDLPSMLRDSVAEVWDASDAVIVCHPNPAYRQAAQTRRDVPVIDLVGLFSGGTAPPHVNGIGW
jgi:GDP-mannose 6-dehydrogenase